MTGEKAPGNTRGTPSPVVQQLIAMFAAAVLMTAIAVVAVAISGGLPPRLGLTSTTWQWTGSTTGRDAAPLEVPDPAAYTIRFTRDLTFEATADCNQASGTYSSVAAGTGRWPDEQPDRGGAGQPRSPRAAPRRCSKSSSRSSSRVPHTRSQGRS